MPRTRGSELRLRTGRTLADAVLGACSRPGFQLAEIVPATRFPTNYLEIVLGGLQGEQFGVLAAQREQVGVHAMLDDLPVAQHVDPVRVLDAG